MRRPEPIRWQLLAVFALALAAPARAEPPLTYRTIREMQPPAVGLRLLGPERGTDIVRIDFPDVPPEARGLPSVLQLFLYARPVPVGPTHCSQQLFYRLLGSTRPMELRPLRRAEPLRVISGWEEVMFARPPGCRLAPGQLFAVMRDSEIGMRALDDLAAAQAGARGAGPMVRFELTCADEAPWDPDHCARGGRETLAHLPLDQACRVDAVDGDPSVVEVTLCVDWHLWVLRLHAGGPEPGRLSMLWKDTEGTY